MVKNRGRRNRQRGQEEWRPICIDGSKWIWRYEVSNQGRVRAHPLVSARGSKPGRILKTNVDSKGYPQVDLWLDSHRHTRKIHRLVALAFIGPKPDGCTINHKDSNKTNNRVENLEYISNKENIRHGWRNRRGVCIDEVLEQRAAHGVTRKVLWRRMTKHDWSLDAALTTPRGQQPTEPQGT